MSPARADMTAKSPPEPTATPTPVSPLSPSLRPGFEKVGLLPSERSSLMDATRELEQNGGSRVTEALRDQAKELQEVSVPHNVDTTLDVAEVNHADQAAKQALEDLRGEEANEIAQAFYDALSKHSIDQRATQKEAATEDNSTIQGPDNVDTAHIPSQPKLQEQIKDLTDSDFLVPKEGRVASAHKSNIKLTLIKGHKTSIPSSTDPSTEHNESSTTKPSHSTSIPQAHPMHSAKPDATETLASPDHSADPAFDALSTRAYFGDPSDRDNPLSQTIRETLTSETAQLRDSTYHKDSGKGARKPLRLKLHVEVFESSDGEVDSSLCTSVCGTAAGASSLVAFGKVDELGMGNVVHAGLVFGYLVCVVAVFAFGPVVLITAFFKLWLVLKVYVSMVSRLDGLHPYTDVIVGALECVEDLMVQQAAVLAQKVIKVLVGMLMEALRGVSEDVEMGVKHVD
jgi:hypothetical protein